MIINDIMATFMITCVNAGHKGKGLHLEIIKPCMKFHDIR